MGVSSQEAMIYIMVAMSAVDRMMTDAELSRIGTISKNLPHFSGFDSSTLPEVSERCAELLAESGGLDKLLTLVQSSIPASHHDLAYALAVDVAAADLSVEQEESRFLDLLKDTLELDQLTVTAIERAAKARFRQ